MMKKVNFTYSRLGKAFKKQRKVNENQGEKQIKSIEQHGKRLASFNALDIENNNPSYLEQKEIFNKLVDKRSDKILKLSRKVSYYDLTYYYKGKDIGEKCCNKFNNVFRFPKKIRDVNITLEKATKIKMSINQIKRVKNKSHEKKLHCSKQKRFIKLEKVLSNFLMVLLQ